MPITVNDSTFGAIMGFGTGIYWFFRGFQDLKTRRTIENIPTSKIMTGAVGSDVEVNGRIVCEADKMQTAPISRSTCAFYSIEIQKLRRNKNNTYWETLDQYFSDQGFYIDDGSGATALIMVDKARITRTGASNNHYRMRSNHFSEIPQTLGQSLENHKSKLKQFRLKKTSWLFSSEYRFVEWSFKAGEMVYVLGFAESGLKAPKKQKIKFNDFLKAKKLIQKNPKLQKKFDRNKDGKLDLEEMDYGAKIIAEKIREKYSKEKLDSLVSKTRMIFKHKKGHQYIISNMKETELAKKIAGLSFLKIWGGPALTIACALILLYQFEII